MNQLPNELQYKIYEYKHNIGFNDVMKEFKKMTIRCFFNIDVGLADMLYFHHGNFFCKCININNLGVTPKEILNTIKKLNIKI